MPQGTLSRCKLVTVLCLVAAFLSSCQPLIPDLEVSAVPSRSIKANDLGWREIWRRPLRLRYSETPAGVVVNDTIIVALENQNDIVLTALNTQNGQTIWMQEVASPYGVLDAIVADANQVYVAASFVVKAFRAKNGEPLWTSPELLTHTRHDLYRGSESDIIYDQARKANGQYVQYAIDSKNGAVKDVTTSTRVPKLQVDNTVYYIENEYDLARIDDSAAEPIWTIKTRGVKNTPVLLGSNILVFQDGPFETSLNGINPASGAQLWRTPQNNIVSNFVSDGRLVYAIVPDPAAIISYEAATGQPLGSIEFGGDPLDINNNPGYWLFISESKRFVYLSDSQELIAFESNK